ncbi:MAG: 2-(1,2-epoxy-1,2-dihydrophenyl)acetyl-CoA isomerase [candidate division GAL15 bacterium]
MDYQTLRWELSDGVLTLTLNRPEVLNAVNDRMAEELLDALRRAARQAEVRSVILTGAGRAFCSGQDLRERAGNSFSYAQHIRTRYVPVIVQLQSLEKPVVAAVNGVAAGAGASLALACDLRVASEEASFLQAFTRIGLLPDSGATYFLPRLVGLGKAFELCYLAEPVGAREALRLGLVNWVVPGPQLMDKAREVASRLASGPTRAYGFTKRALLHNLTADLASALDYEAMLQEAAGRTEDHREGVQAFLEKRPPRYLGR